MPLEDELPGLKKLSPAERIRKLKELEEARKKDIEQAERLLMDAEREALDDAEKTDLPVPQMKAVSADALETIDAKILWAAKHGMDLKQAAESTVMRAGELEGRVGNKPEEQSSAQYGDALEAAMQQGSPQYAPKAGKGVSDYSSARQDYETPQLHDAPFYESNAPIPGKEMGGEPQGFYRTSNKSKKGN